MSEATINTVINVDREELLRQLIKIRDHGPFCAVVGICSNLDWDKISDAPLLEARNHVLARFYRTWPEYSRDQSFPVPAPEDWTPRNCASARATIHEQFYCAYENKRHFWSSTHPYGQARRRLLDHLILSIEKELEE